jgi:cobalt-precorrin-5B (C1)-methyltransferase
LRRGWTTGACATAAAKAAYLGWRTGEFPDPVEIVLPGGARPAFALAQCDIGRESARVGVVKDAGDDPDVTHRRPRDRDGPGGRARLRRRLPGGARRRHGDPAGFAPAAGGARHQSHAPADDPRQPGGGGPRGGRAPDVVVELSIPGEKRSR